MDVPELPKTTPLILHERMHAHSIECADTGEKDVELIVEALEYIYTSHDCMNRLPSSVELSAIVSRAYDADVNVRSAIDEMKGLSSPEPDSSLDYGQIYAYSGIVNALKGYLWQCSYSDLSEHVSTPEKAQEYVESSRRFNTEISRTFLDEVGGLGEDIEEEDAQDIEKIKQDFVGGLIDLAGQTDASIIAEAAVPYKDTDEGKESFEQLKPFVKELLKYHRLP